MTFIVSYRTIDSSGQSEANQSIFTYSEHPAEHTMSETPAEEVNGGEDVQDKKSKKTAKHDGGVADLERVTDYAEEKELSSADISNAINIFGDKRNKETAEKLAKEQELQKIHVKKEDIELIMEEMLISRQQAEKTLRENRGDVVAALIALTN